MEKLKCKCVKGIDGFTWGEVYDVEFAGRVWWAVNDDGKRVSGASESFDPIEEPVSDDLKKAAIIYNKKANFVCAGEIPNEHFIAGAQWQKQQDQETIELAEDHAMLAGMEKMKEEMMANGVDGVVHHFEKCEVASVHYNDPTGVPMSYFMSSKGFLAGDKVKIIVIKED